MRVRAALTLAIPILSAALFIRLGVWQLARLGERRAFNRVLYSRLQTPPMLASALPSDTGAGHYLRVTAHGRFLYDKEIAWAGRSRQGSPGVYLLTPFSVEGRDSLFLVNRGWVYSPDAAGVEHPRWRERDTATVAGYVETYSAPAAPAPRGARAATIRSLDRQAVERAVGKPVADYLIVQTSDSALRADSVPDRLAMPVLDEGPHTFYAIQWFAFAVIALAGGVALFIRSR
jgi:surfeit locus 1 family protein